MGAVRSCAGDVESDVTSAEGATESAAAAVPIMQSLRLPAVNQTRPRGSRTPCQSLGQMCSKMQHHTAVIGRLSAIPENDRCGSRIDIPSEGRCNSLNLSSSCRRQRSSTRLLPDSPRGDSDCVPNPPTVSPANLQPLQGWPFRPDQPIEFTPGDLPGLTVV